MYLRNRKKEEKCLKNSKIYRKYSGIGNSDHTSFTVYKYSCMVQCMITVFQRGLFGQIGHELNLIGKTVGRELDYGADQINKALSTTATGQVLVR